MIELNLLTVDYSRLTEKITEEKMYYDYSSLINAYNAKLSLQNKPLLQFSFDAVLYSFSVGFTELFFDSSIAGESVISYNKIMAEFVTARAWKVINEKLAELEQQDD